MPERTFWRVSWFNSPCRTARDGSDKVEELHTALTIVGESHDGEDHAKASYHDEGRDREPLPESPTMETTKSESPTRENAGRGDYPENVMTQRTPLENSVHESMPGSPTME